MTQKVATGGTPSKAPIGYLTWATEESGLLLACSVKTIMFRDGSLETSRKPDQPSRRSDR
jgi:hypothetical protein